MIRISSHTGRGWTQVGNQQDFQEICERCGSEASACNVPLAIDAWRGVETNTVPKRKNDKNQKLVCR